MVTLIFLRGLCEYVWVNILTLSPLREYRSVYKRAHVNEMAKSTILCSNSAMIQTTTMQPDYVKATDGVFFALDKQKNNKVNG